MDPLSELQDDLTLDDTSQTLNQLKLASIDEKNWPSDEMPDFPKSGGHRWIPGSHRHLRGGAPLSAEGRAQEGRIGAGNPAPEWDGIISLTVRKTREHESPGTLCHPPDYPPDFTVFLR